jgi:putative transposase
VPHDVRDQIVDFVRRWSEASEIGAGRFIGWLGVTASKFYSWRQRYGRANEHNGWVPRDFWLEDWEKQAIIGFHLNNPLEGYRRLTFMMLDADIVAVSPSSVWRVLSQAGLLRKWNGKPSKKGTGFEQPPAPHQHWHIDVSYINIAGTFYYLCSVLDGFSRFIVHWDLRPAMTEGDIEIILQAAREQYPEARPRIISDNGPQFIARDFQEFIRIAGMTHVRTSPYYPQSNGKIERWHKSLKRECLRPGTPLTPEDARRLIQRYVDHYNTVRLHSAIGFVTPADMLAGRQKEIHEARDRKLEEARRAAATAPPTGSMRRQVTMALPGETEAGSAGTQPCRGIAWRAHRDDAGERGSRLSRSSQNHIGSKDPHALKIPARRAECSLTGNARFPFQAEPEHRVEQLKAEGKFDKAARLIDSHRNTTLQRLLDLFVGFETAVKDSYRPVAIVLETCGAMLALLADSIEAVETLDPSTFETLEEKGVESSSDLVLRVAQRSRGQSSVGLIESDRLLPGLASAGLPEAA